MNNVASKSRRSTMTALQIEEEVLAALKEYTECPQLELVDQLYEDPRFPGLYAARALDAATTGEQGTMTFTVQVDRDGCALFGDVYEATFRAWPPSSSGWL